MWKTKIVETTQHEPFYKANYFLWGNHETDYELEEPAILIKNSERNLTSSHKNTEQKKVVRNSNKDGNDLNNNSSGENSVGNEVSHEHKEISLSTKMKETENFERKEQRYFQRNRALSPWFKITSLKRTHDNGNPLVNVVLIGRDTAEGREAMHLKI